MMTGKLDYEAFLASISETPPVVAVCDASRLEDDMTLNFLEMSGAEFQRTVRDDPDKWADAAMVAAEDMGYKIDRDWIRPLLADAMAAAREGSIREVIRPAVP